MFLHRFYDDKLAQASYLVGCQATGEALVVDPNRDVEQYLRVAAAEGLRVTHVTETHIHADFVSGSRELAERTKAQLFLSDEGDADWKYAFAADAGATLLKDGDTFMVGNLKVDVLHTPGHTPEHLAFLLTDTPATDRPMGIFTGDFVFVGDVGRPDLLEKAAGIAGTMEAGARTLYASLQRFKELPDWLQLWPGHGAGSACGKALGAVPSSTVGYEKIANWGLLATSEAEFVAEVLAGQPEPPRYFAEMKRINKTGPRSLHDVPRAERAPASWFAPLVAGGALVVDTRPADEFAGAYLPGTVNIPLNKSFTTWAGSLVPYDRPFHLLVDDHDGGAAVEQALHDLAMIGLDQVAGWFGADALDAASQEAQLSIIRQVRPEELEPLLREGSVAVVDVRSAAEWELGHLPGVVNIPLPRLVERAGELPLDRPVVVQCQSGARSAIAASVLLAIGVRDVMNLVGGFTAWDSARLPVERESALAGA
jgi:hydroxyacylglutathione hydrolase